jgi:hypothetical protein
MQNEQQKRARMARRIVTIVVIVIAVMAVAVGVALLLKNVVKPGYTPPNAPQVGQTTTPLAPSSASVINDYVTSDTLHSLSNNYQLEPDGSVDSWIIYKADHQTYAINVPASHHATYYAVSHSQQNDSQTFQTQTTTFMQSRGFQKASSSAPSTDPAAATVLTYTDLGSVCQLTGTPSSVPAYYSLACADKTDVQKAYSTAQTLLTLYQKSHQLNSFTQAITDTNTSGNNTMTTISLTMTTAHPILLFVATNNVWSYIGDLGGSIGEISNGKYVITPDVADAMHDPRYGTFLTHYLQ